MAVLASVIFTQPAPVETVFVASDINDSIPDTLYTVAGVVDYYEDLPPPAVAEAAIDTLLNVALRLNAFCRTEKTSDADQALADAVEVWLAERNRF